MIHVVAQRVKKLINAPLIFLIWFFYNSAYLALINVDVGIKAGYFVLFGQVSLDIIICVYSFILYKKTHKNYLKLAYLFFCLSAISAAIADCIYHIGMNIINVAYFNEVNSFFEIPFIFFLLFQVIAWGVIFFIDDAGHNEKRYAYFPYLTVSIFIFFTFVYIVPWKIHYLSKLGLYQLVDTVLEVTGFSLSALCLTRSKDNPIRFLSMGYLLIISSDLLIRYDVVSGIIPVLNIFETTWIFGLLFMASGFVVASRGCSIRLLPLNSLQSYITIWLLNLLLVFVGAFLFLNYFFPHRDVSHYLLWMIIPCTFFSILGSKYFASKILSPLARLELIIKEFLSTENLEHSTIVRPPVHIEDFNLLEQFVYDAFDLYKKNHYIKMEHAKIATQVAHDIQSPMLALNNYFREAIKLNINKYEVVEASLYRINEITNNLLTQYKQPENNSLKINNDVELIGALLQPLIEEKKLQFKGSSVEIGLFIEKSAEFSCVSLNSEHFKRTISNLINNAVESIKESGQVTVSLKRKINSLFLEIKDTGSGMPADILKNIEKGEELQNGNGLGLPYALKIIKEWSASYTINSEKDLGTSFEITFPIQKAPEWIQHSIYIHDELTVVVVDDDYSVFKTWEQIIKNSYENIKLIYLDSPEKLEIFLKDLSNTEDILFLVDYFFHNSPITGMDLIKKLSLNNAIVVSSKYPDAALKTAVQENNIQYILKQNIFSVSFIKIHADLDLVLIDDNKLINEIWGIESKKHKKKIITFTSKNSFMKHYKRISKSTPIYLDLCLGKENGDEVAKQLFELGYKKLYITTGYDIKKVNKSPWIKDILGKEPPFSKIKKEYSYE